MSRIEETDEFLTIGAAVTYSDAFDRIGRHWPDFGELLRRLGGGQVRNVGTIGGNIANGSPIGDTPPPLIALGAILLMDSADGPRELALETFFLEYGRQDRRPGEFVAAVRIPLPREGQRFGCYKLSKRFDQDISAVCAAFWITLGDDGLVGDARFAFGGMAAVPKRAPEAESAVIGGPWNDETIDLAMRRLDVDFAPITDHRASGRYRSLAARNLLYRFFLESSDSGTETRLPGMRGAADD